MNIPVVVINASGITCPTYEDIYNAYVAAYQGIYGPDVVLTSDTQDGQWLGVQAQAHYDCCLAVVAAYEAYSPKSAQGAGLSSLVKINGLRRNVFTFSTAVVTINGENGTTINNGLVGDDQNLGTQWALPSVVNIGGAGFVNVTATCTTPGSIPGPANTLNVILTPTRGWTSVNNAADAAVGAPVEIDSTLRQRQSVSTGKPAQTPLQAIKAEILNLTDVDDCSAWENDNDFVDGNGIPAHSISMVVDGGDVQQIINAIGSKKNPGCGTYGSTSGTYVDPAGVDDTIRFFVLAKLRTEVQIDGVALANWSTDTIPIIQQAVADYINSLADGQNCNIANVSAASVLNSNPVLAETFDITTVEQRFHGGSFAPSNLVVNFNQRATCNPNDVSVSIT